MFAFFILMALIWFAFLMPAKAIAPLLIVGLVVSAAVRFTSHAITGTAPSYFTALKAVGLSLVLTGLAVFTLFSFAAGAPSVPPSLAAVSLPVLLFGPLLGYVLGFRIVLGVGIGPSAAIAFISSAISIALIAVLRSVLHW